MRSFLILLFLFVVVMDTASGQSKKEVLKKAIAAYKENPHPPFKGYAVHVHPFVADSTVEVYYYGFQSDQEKPAKYYISETFNVIATLDTMYSYTFWNEKEYPSIRAHLQTEKQLYEQNLYAAMPPQSTIPLNTLGKFYLRKNKALMTDTTIDGEICFRFEIKYKDTFDPITGLNVTDSRELITISWNTGLIREYAVYDKWDGDTYKYYYRFDYIDDSSWQEKIRTMEAEIAGYFMDFVPSTETKFQKSQLAVGDTIQYWHFKQLGGDSIDIRTLNRDFYVLDIWYTSCGPCVGAIPNTNRLDSAIRQYNAAVLGITTAHKSDAFLEAFVQKRNIQYSLFTYSGNTIDTHFPISYYPTYILVNKDGCILHISEGASRYDYKQEIEDIIKAAATK